MKTFARESFAALAFIVAAANGSAVMAADQPSQLFRGLFGPDPSIALTSHPVLELRVNTFEARGRTPSDTLEQTVLQAEGFYTGVSSGLTFRQKTRNALFTVGTGNTLRMYPSSDVTTTEHSGFASMDLQASRYTTVRRSEPTRL